MITEKQILVVEDEVITAMDIQRRLKSWDIKSLKQYILERKQLKK